MIRIEGLRVAFGRTIALDSLDLELRPGVTGLFGPNGSGKSTLLRVLAGFVKPTAGKVTFDGAELRSSDERLRKRLGYVGHEAGLYPRLSVAENLCLFATLYSLAQERVEETLEQLGLGDVAATPVGALSAGVKRRAAVARGVLHEPDVLLLDEPYANLDDEASELVSEAIKAWRAGSRVGLVATHGAKRVKRYADAGVILQRGQVVVSGSYRQDR